MTNEVGTDSPFKSLFISSMMIGLFFLGDHSSIMIIISFLSCFLWHFYSLFLSVFFLISRQILTCRRDAFLWTRKRTRTIWQTMSQWGVARRLPHAGSGVFSSLPSLLFSFIYFHFPFLSPTPVLSPLTRNHATSVTTPSLAKILLVNREKDFLKKLDDCVRAFVIVYLFLLVDFILISLDYFQSEKFNSTRRVDVIGWTSAKVADETSSFRTRMKRINYDR